MKIKITLKIIAFITIFALLFTGATSILLKPDFMNYHNFGGFYEEPENSLDAVYIGSSNCFTFWNSLLAWGNYGISVYPYAGNSVLFFASEYYIREARKTQPDAVFIVNINSVTDGGIPVDSMRNMIDCMPFSFNKLKMIHDMMEIGDFSFADSLEYYFPMIRFHSRWKELKSSDVELPLNGLKGSPIFDEYLKVGVDITDNYVLTEKEGVLAEKLLDSAKRLLDYCDEEQVKVVFVTVPQAKYEDFRVERFNGLNAYIESRGYPVLELLSDPEEMGLDLKADFYNTAHTNIHGSAKFTQYVANYLIENYGFTDKRQDPDYAAWNTAFDSYTKMVSPYLLDIERDGEKRTLDLEVPQLTVGAQGAGNLISWKGVAGADGYRIYRKTSKATAWVVVSETKDLSFLDPSAEAGALYTYTVLPFKEGTDGRTYGKFSYTGSSLQR